MVLCSGQAGEQYSSSSCTVTGAAAADGERRSSVVGSFDVMLMLDRDLKKDGKGCREQEQTQAT
jgi:hypothetical protein